MSANLAKRRRTARIALVLAIVVPALVLGFAWWLDQLRIEAEKAGPHLDEVAFSAFEAMMRADGEALLELTFEEEIEKNQLTPEKLYAVYSELVLPRLAAATRRPGDVKAGYEKMGLGGFEYATALDYEMPICAEVYMTPKGLRLSALTPLFHAWMIEYFSVNGEVFNLESRNKAMLAGLQKDAKKLEEIGITHLPLVRVPELKITMVPIGKFGRGYERWVADPTLHP
jgi:hypothetical protein